MDPDHITIDESDRRALNAVNRGDSGSFSRPFYLHLGSDGEKIPKNMQGCRIQTRCSKAGIP